MKHWKIEISSICSNFCLLFRVTNRMRDNKKKWFIVSHAFECGHWYCFCLSDHHCWADCLSNEKRINRFAFDEHSSLHLLGLHNRNEECLRFTVAEIVFFFMCNSSIQKQHRSCTFLFVIKTNFDMNQKAVYSILK